MLDHCVFGCHFVQQVTGVFFRLQVRRQNKARLDTPPDVGLADSKILGPAGVHWLVG